MQHTTLALADSSCSEIRINPFLGICDLLRQLLTINPIFLSITLHDICTPYLIKLLFHLSQDIWNQRSQFITRCVQSRLRISKQMVHWYWRKAKPNPSSVSVNNDWMTFRWNIYIFYFKLKLFFVKIYLMIDWIIVQYY